MPNSVAVRMIRSAISPRLAISSVALIAAGRPTAPARGAVPLSSLPPALRGSALSTTVTYCGTLKSASCPRQCSSTAADIDGLAAEQHRTDLLSHDLVGHGQHARVRDVGRRQQHRFHLDAGDVLTTAVDDVLEPIDDVHPARVVDPDHVAGVQPAAHERGRGGLRPIPVAGGHIGAAHDQLPHARLVAAERDHRRDPPRGPHIRPSRRARRHQSRAARSSARRVSVMPYPLNTVACGKASFTDRTNDGAIGAPP